MKYTEILLCMTLVLVFASCKKLDVVGNGSIQSFAILLQKIPAAEAESALWSLSAPDNSARFFWSKNFVPENALDLAVEFSAEPFIRAGLDPSKLPAGYSYRGGLIITGIKLGMEQAGGASPLASYEQIVKYKRDSIGYHAAMDHFGLNLGNGNLFEWARDMKANDNDMVFVLNPEPFILAGADPANIEGWTFTKVSVHGENGKPVQVDKLLKPFGLP